MQAEVIFNLQRQIFFYDQATRTKHLVSSAIGCQVPSVKGLDFSHSEAESW
jgi:hypothetical protein